MNADDLFIKLSFLGPSGHTLNVEESSALQSSLALLKKSGKFRKVIFWGKVFGINRDYMIAQGIGSSFFGPKTSFTSHDGTDWFQLPDISDEIAAYCDQITGRFTGDPSTETRIQLPESHTNQDGSSEEVAQSDDNKAVSASESDREHTEESEGEIDESEGEPASEMDRSPEKKFIVITEEKRLARFIQLVDKDTCVVPRGAFMLTASQQVIENTSFTGLAVSDADNLQSYMHLRPPENIQKKTLLEKEPLIRSLDFMDTIDEDVPRGCWTITRDRVSNLVTIRSLLWPGFTSYHVANSNNFGYAYFGFGEKNNDLGFML